MYSKCVPMNKLLTFYVGKVKMIFDFKIITSENVILTW